MSRRAALPPEAMKITPGYSWRLDLDVAFDGVRPDDWPNWIVRMHIWTDCGLRLALRPAMGVTFEGVEDLPGASEPVTIPVIRLTSEQTSAMATRNSAINYLIDLQAPDGDAEDYFAGLLTFAGGPPLEMLT